MNTDQNQGQTSQQNDGHGSAQQQSQQAFSTNQQFSTFDTQQGGSAVSGQFAMGGAQQPIPAAQPLPPQMPPHQDQAPVVPQQQATIAPPMQQAQQTTPQAAQSLAQPMPPQFNDMQAMTPQTQQQQSTPQMPANQPVSQTATPANFGQDQGAVASATNSQNQQTFGDDASGAVQQNQEEEAEEDKTPANYQLGQYIKPTVHIKLPAHQLNFDEAHFLDLLAGSISLSKDEKKRILDAIPKLKQQQIDELIRIFTEERSKFSELSGKHVSQLEKLAKQHANDWEDIEMEYAAQTKQASEAQEADEIRKQLGL